MRCVAAAIGVYLGCSGATTAYAQEPASIRVVHWNVQYDGLGTDGIRDRSRQTSWLAAQRPDIVTLNEVTASAAADYQSRLQSATRETWYRHHVSAVTGDEGNAILARFPIVATSGYVMKVGLSRSVTQATLDIGGTRVNVFATHLDNGDRPASRAAQVEELLAFTARFPRPHIVAGDLNAGPEYAELQPLFAAYADAWDHAVDAGTAFAYAPDNPPGRFTRTHWKRIDYLLTSDDGRLHARECDVPDQRDLANANVTKTIGTLDDKGVRPSDHNLFVCTLSWQAPASGPDMAAPTAAFLAPSADETVGRLVKIEVGAADDVGVVDVEFLVDGRLVAVDRSAPYEYEWRSDTAAAGPHTLTAVATDAAGNRAVITQTVAVAAVTNSTAEVVLWAAEASVAKGWTRSSNTAAAGGAHLANANAGVTAPAPLAAPGSYFELTFPAEQGRAYRLWIRGRAEGASTANDSVYVQFTNSAGSDGMPLYRIGSTSAAAVSLEEFPKAGVSEWGWADNGYGMDLLGPAIYFTSTGIQTVRVQPREDGLSIDQIVLSSANYLTAAPGWTKNDHTLLPRTVTQPATMPGSISATTVATPTTTADTTTAADAGSASGGGTSGTTADGNEIVLWTAASARIAGNWHVVPDATAAGGALVQNPDAGLAKAAVSANPMDYFELTFNAEAGRAYRLWIRGRAQKDTWANDSVYVQFSNAVDAAGAPLYRTGTTAAAAITLEDCTSCGVSGWGWQDAGYGAGVLAPPIYFAAAGTQTIRFQRREDGLGIDQVILSASQWFSTGPGTLKNDTTIVPLPATAGPDATAPSSSTSTADPVATATEPVAAAGEPDGATTGDSPVTTTSETLAPTASPTTTDATTQAAMEPSTATDTAGTPTLAPIDEIVVWAARSATLAGNWKVVPDATAAGGALVQNSDAALAKAAVAASPADFFELTVTAEANKPYRLWIRGRAHKNSWANDSVYAQFSGAVDAAGAPLYRIGTTAAAVITIEDCTSCGLSGWGWQDAGFGAGVLGPVVYFATSGPQTIRFQRREDGLSIDQVVLSAARWMMAAPGALKNDAMILEPSTSAGVALATAPEPTAPLTTTSTATTSTSEAPGGATTDGEGSGTSAPAPISPSLLPQGWQSVDVGAVGQPGSASGSDGTFTVSGGGADIWGTADALHYAYRTLAGDGTIVAQVASITGVQAWTKVGVMIRATPDAKSAHAMMMVTPGKGTAFQRRVTTGGLSTSTTGSTTTVAPYWVKLSRAGNTVTASMSADGVVWKVVGRDTIPLPSTVLVGLAVSSHDPTRLATGTFVNVGVSTP